MAVGKTAEGTPVAAICVGGFDTVGEATTATCVGATGAADGTLFGTGAALHAAMLVALPSKIRNKKIRLIHPLKKIG